MSIPAFDPKELEYVEVPGFGGMPMKTFNYPLNKHDHGVAMFSRKPWWQGMQAMDAQIFTPRIIPDNVARAFVFENSKFDANTEGGGPDMFGVEWEYVPTVGGSMVRPGVPFLEDISEWREKVVWPDIDSWDWEGSGKLNNGTFLKPENFNQIWFQTGFFERLIALMEFEGAAMALMDEDAQEDVHAFFDKLTDLYIRIFGKIIETYPNVNAVFFHDDWGSQRAPFFSPALAEEMIVPYMRRLTDFLHSKGIFCELHSCGCNALQVPNYIKAGWDAWAPQLMNDCYDLYDKYGDKLLIATFPQNIPEEIMALPTTEEQGKAFAALPEEEQRRIAREYVDRVCQPGKPSFYNYYASHWLTPAFREEMYKQSRINYSK
ncbi:MAG: uroporphyrinogen decarboxylase family protein [Clostridiales bacterium]|nr:uroporphyrinogen decarboxylase family protein [Clostridiales bacterium]